jgi:hypothetical protein
MGQHFHLTVVRARALADCAYTLRSLPPGATVECAASGGTAGLDSNLMHQPIAIINGRFD